MGTLEESFFSLRGLFFSHADGSRRPSEPMGRMALANSYV